MTHDFAKKPKSKKKEQKKQSSIPGWAWFFTGLISGIFICFLAYLSEVIPEPAVAAQALKQTPEKASPKKTKPKTRFDFYTLLPEREIIVPVEKEQSIGAPDQPTIYLLQAGSFKSENDADRLRAELILMGFETTIEGVTVDGGDRWHRVQVGPFMDRSSLAKARGTLISNGIDALLLKRKVNI